jgi:hypothetical protein
MIGKIIRALSVIAIAMLVSGVLFTLSAEQASATGTNVVTAMSLGPDAVQNTFRSEQIAGALAVALVIIGGIFVVRSHGGEGLIGVLFIAVGIGLIMQSAEAIQEMGITAAGI